MFNMNKDILHKLIKSVVKESIDDIKIRELVNEDYHHLHKDYRLYEGNRNIVAIFEDNTRLTFEVHYRGNHGEDRDKHRHKAFTKWKSVASKIHGDAPLNEVGNPIQKSWKEAFKEALEHPDLQEFIRHSSHHKVFEDKDAAPCIDPVNFTSH